MVHIWKDTLQKKPLVIDPDAESSPCQVDAMLGSAQVAEHGLICFNSYNRLHKELAALGESMTKIISSGLIDSVTVISARVGQKRKPRQA